MPPGVWATAFQYSAGVPSAPADLLHLSFLTIFPTSYGVNAAPKRSVGTPPSCLPVQNSPPIPPPGFVGALVCAGVLGNELA
eukprot:1676341-Pyramimonas_sp.AAC.1